MRIYFFSCYHLFSIHSDLFNATVLGYESRHGITVILVKLLFYKTFYIDISKTICSAAYFCAQ